jgi:hypothetical protein
MATNSRLFRQETVEAVAPYPRLFARRLGAATFHRQRNLVSQPYPSLPPAAFLIASFQCAKTCV